jgi:PAS domain-containing protein
MQGRARAEASSTDLFDGNMGGDARARAASRSRSRAASVPTSSSPTCSCRSWTATSSCRVEELGRVNQEQRRLHDELLTAQRQTAESPILLETLQETAPIGIAFVDRAFRIQRINEKLATMTGPALEEAIGRTLREVAPDRWPQVEPFYRHVLHPGEADLLRSVVMDTMAEGLYDGDGQLSLMNEAGSSMLGWSERELCGQRVHDAMHARRPDGSPCPEHDSELCDAIDEAGLVLYSQPIVPLAGDGPASEELLLQTIAEGVENEEVLELLRDYDVDFAQGFHLGRPSSMDSSTLV